MRTTRIIIFAKAPRPGFAKTRLIPALGAEGAADLARRMLIQAVNEALRADVGPVELCVTPSRADPAWPAEVRSATVQWSEQGEGGLGERLERAASRVVEAGESVLLTGTDCPELDAGRLRESAESLGRHDCSLVPAADGGYALLGLNRSDASIFTNIPWSTDRVADETVRRVFQLGWTLAIHALVHDIDEPADLKWLADHLSAAPPASPTAAPTPETRTLTRND